MDTGASGILLPDSLSVRAVSCAALSGSLLMDAGDAAGALDQFMARVWATCPPMPCTTLPCICRRHEFTVGANMNIFTGKLIGLILTDLEQLSIVQFASPLNYPSGSDCQMQG